MGTMVRLTYTPEGGSKRSWEFDVENPPWDVMKFAPKAVGCGWLSFGQRLADLDAEAFQAIVWVLRKRDEPRLEMDGVQFPSGLLAEVQLEELDAPEVEDPKETA